MGIYLFASFLACQDGKQWISEQYTPTYAAPINQNPATNIVIKQVVRGLVQPTDIRFPEHHPNYMVVTQKKGEVVVLSKENDIYSNPQKMALLSVRSSSELGVLSIAFHPDYTTNHRVYIYSTPKKGKMRGEISEWKVKDFSTWKLNFVRTVLEIEQPYGNHNGGQLQFGADKMLYLSLGDGGWRDDPHQNGQNTKSLLGSIIRIKPTPFEQTAYVIPKDNPFIGRSDFDEHMYVYGLRNPWRFSFDSSGALIIADVGQNEYEEVSVAHAGDNLGWNQYEGKHCFVSSCTLNNHLLPIWEYDHQKGTSITGGYVSLNPQSSLFGTYVVGDFTSGRIWSLSLKGEASEIGVHPILISTFGRDQKGDIYAADFGKGSIFRLEDSL